MEWGGGGVGRGWSGEGEALGSKNMEGSSVESTELCLLDVFFF